MSDHRTRALFVAWVAVVCLTIGVRAQTPAPASYITLDVVVENEGKKGQSLATADFEVVDSGEIRPLDDVRLETGGSRAIAIFLDEYHVQAGAAERVREALAQFVQTEVRSGVGVTVGADVNLNFSMTVGAVNEKIEVTGEVAQVDTSGSAMGGFVNATTIRELPLNGRDWLQLTLLQPGALNNPGTPQADTARAQNGNGLQILRSRLLRYQ